VVPGYYPPRHEWVRERGSNPEDTVFVRPVKTGRDDCREDRKQSAKERQVYTRLTNCIWVSRSRLDMIMASFSMMV
jgi:hypothetical protein